MARSSEANKETGKEEVKASASDHNNEEKIPNKSAAAKNQTKPKNGTHRESSGGPELEIGTWSNDMAWCSPAAASFDGREADDDFEIDTFDPTVALPDNLTMLEGNFGDDDIEGELGADWGTGLTERKTRGSTPRAKEKSGGDEVMRVGSPSNFEADGWDAYNGDPSPVFGSYGGAQSGYCYDYGDDFDGYESEQEEEEEEEEFECQEKSGAGNNWEEQGKRRGAADKRSQSDEEGDDNLDWPDECLSCPEEKEREFARMIERSKEELRQNRSRFLAEDEPIVIEKACRKKLDSLTNESSSQTDDKVLFDWSLRSRIISIKRDINAPENGREDDPNQSVNEDASKNESQRVDKATQTDVVSFAMNSDPEIRYNVDREKTLAEVRTASETLALTAAELEKAREESATEGENAGEEEPFSFDEQPDLETHAGPSPSILLQALTMSNANDGVNLERLETIGDSYLKYAITNYLYCTYTQKHEGKLSYLRSKQVSNLNLYRLGKRKGLGECMVATKFEPHDNWLPPGYFVPRELEEALIDSGVPAGHWNMADFPGLHDLGSEEIRQLVHERSEQIKQNKAEQLANELISVSNPQDLPIFIPYNLLTQHSIPDKSISDCVEALIGAYLTTCGPRGALLFMSWLGIKVLPSTVNKNCKGEPFLTYHQLLPPPSPLEPCPFPDAEEQLDLLLSGYNEFEKKIGYTFRDRSYLLQAFTHASYYRNRLTDCYQRLEFLGDAVLGK